MHLHFHIHIHVNVHVHVVVNVHVVVFLAHVGVYVSCSLKCFKRQLMSFAVGWNGSVYCKCMFASLQWVLACVRHSTPSQKQLLLCCGRISRMFTLPCAGNTYEPTVHDDTASCDVAWRLCFCLSC